MTTAEPPKLSGKRAAYVREVLAGHAPKEAAARAGLPAGAEERLQSDPTVRAHIRVGKLHEVDDTSILLFWVDMMHNAEDDGHRLKASELLAKSRGLLREKLEVTGQVSLTDLVLAASRKDKP